MALISALLLPLLGCCAVHRAVHPPIKDAALFSPKRNAGVLASSRVVGPLLAALLHALWPLGALVWTAVLLMILVLQGRYEPGEKLDKRFEREQGFELK